MFEIRTLGGLSTYWHGKRFRLGTRKGIALLTYLASHRGQPFARSDLANLLWHRAPEARARHSLSQTLYSLRKRLPVQVVQATRHEIWTMEDHVRVDALEFDDYLNDGCVQEAISLYRGDFLEGFWLEDALGFCKWQELRRSELRKSVSVGLYELLQRAEQGGNWLVTERLAQRVLEFNPYDERIHHIRLSAIAATGNRRRLDREYHNLVMRFQNELGRRPGSALRDIVEGPHEDYKDLYEVGEREVAAQVPFIGREEEFRKLRREWAAVRDGYGRSVLVTGEAGIGKTRFCRHFLRLTVLQNARVLDGRCYPSESRLPYSGVVDAFVHGLRPDDLHSLPNAWSAVVSELLPEMKPDQSTATSLPLADGEGARRRLFEGVARLLVAISEEVPVVLFVDDFHWADDSTSALVQYLSRRLQDCSVLIMVALRPEDVPGDSTMEMLLTTGSHSSHVQDLHLAELDRTSIDQLLTSYTDQTSLEIPNGLRQQIHSQAGGRPFFLLEILHSLERGEFSFDIAEFTGANPSSPVLLPASVEDFLVGRLAELDAAPTRVLGCLAVTGEESPPAVIREMTELTLEAFVGAMEVLVHKRLIREHDSAVAFTHDLIREATYRSLSNLRRRMLHEKAARVMQRRTGVPPGTLAVHFDLAGDSSSAYRYAIEAADTTEMAHAPHEREYFLRMALVNAPTTSQRYTTQHRLATVLYKIRRYSEADILYKGLEKYYRGTNDHVRLLSVEVDRCLIASKQGSTPPEALISRLHVLADTAHKNEAFGQLSRILFKLVELAVDLGRKDIIRNIKPQLLTLAESARGTFAGVEALREAAVLVGLSESVSDGLQYSEEALRQAQTIKNNVALISALSGRAINRLQAGMLSQAEKDFSQSFQISSSAAILQYKNSLFNNYGVLLLERGDYDEAKTTFDKGIRLAEEADAYDEFLIVYENLSILHYEMATFDKAKTVAQTILSYPQRESRWWSTIIAWSILGLCALRRGNFSEANRYRREILLRWEDRNFWIGDSSYPEIFLARLAASEGELAKAVERLDRAIAAYERRDVLCRSRLELERARLLVEEKPVEARRAARKVRDRTAEMGARPLVDKADRIVTRADMRM